MVTPRIAVSRTIEVSPDRVWDVLADLASHHEWMRDARSIVFVGDQRRGEGTRMEVETKVGPFLTTDIMEVTGWDEGHSIEVAHSGLIKGAGTLRVTPTEGGTVVEWIEELSFPWWLGGPITALFARPVLAAIWRGNLRRLEGVLASTGP